MKPAPPSAAIPVEAIMARHMIGRAVFLVLPVVVLGWLLAGSDGAIASILGLAVVVLNFYLAGKVLSLAIRHSLTMYHAAALVGFVLRMALIAGTMLLVVRFVEIDRVAFGISAVVCYLVLVTLEAIAVMRGRERNLDWAG
ncbi:MAG TPA: ATP synthase subunit I [Acidimicrobiia bacterium]|nr:ATP synthase subunit I [Acidimicrobiia bacterium]